MSFDRPSDAQTSIALTTCASVVAMATPATPMRNTSTNSRSSTMFSTQQTIRKYSGRLESPTAR